MKNMTNPKSGKLGKDVGRMKAYELVKILEEVPCGSDICVIPSVGRGDAMDVSGVFDRCDDAQILVLGLDGSYEEHVEGGASDE